jgi:hypothetical protein
MATPVLAASAKEENCTKHADIIDQLVELRLKGKSEKKAIRTLTEGDGAWDEKYHIAVQQYAGWIYSQPRRDAKKHQREPFIKACISQ